MLASQHSAVANQCRPRGGKREGVTARGGLVRRPPRRPAGSCADGRHRAAGGGLPPPRPCCRGGLAGVTTPQQGGRSGAEWQRCIFKPRGACWKSELYSSWLVAALYQQCWAEREERENEQCVLQFDRRAGSCITQIASAVVWQRVPPVVRVSSAGRRYQCAGCSTYSPPRTRGCSSYLASRQARSPRGPPQLASRRVSSAGASTAGMLPSSTRPSWLHQQP